MKTVRQLKEELELNGGLAELMDALKGIAASEFWALSKKQGRFARFTGAFEGFFRFIDFSNARHPFAKEEGALGLVMVTSNEGFMGGLNGRVINEALSHAQAQGAKLIVVGEQGGAYLASLGRLFVEFPGIASGGCYEAALRLRDYIIREAKAGKLGRLILFYPKPVSFMVQKVEELKLLPCTKLFQEAPQETPLEKKGWENIIVESSIDEIVEHLVETWIVQKLFEVFEDSKLAEFSARIVRLEESYQLLLEQGRGIRYQYFRGRHELVDAGMRDVFSAQIVRKKVKRKNRPQGER